MIARATERSSDPGASRPRASPATRDAGPARAAMGHGCSRSSRRRISRSYPGRWRIGPAIGASGPRRPRRRGPPSRWDGTTAYGDTAASSRHSRRASESPVLRPRDPPPEVRGAPGPVTSENRSCAYTKGGLQRSLCGSLRSRAGRPVPWWARRSGGLGVCSMDPYPAETDRGVLYHVRSRIAPLIPHPSPLPAGGLRGRFMTVASIEATI